MLREGLQSDPRVIPTEEKVALARALMAAGFRSLNAVSLVNPRVMPQMADAEAVLDGIGAPAGTTISALVPNPRGMERALAAAGRGLIQEVLFVHATTASVLKVNGMEPDLAKSESTILGLARQAKEMRLRTCVFISASFGCSIEGPVEPAAVLRMAEGLYASGHVDEVVFSDSTGQADPLQVTRFFEPVLRMLSGRPFTVHFHDSRGAALANAYALLQLDPAGLTLDCAVAGLGGDAPFLPQAAGNVCSEDLLQMLLGLGVRTGVDLDAVLEISARIVALYPGRYIPSHTLHVGRVAWK